MPTPHNHHQSLKCPLCHGVVRIAGKHSGERLTCPGCYEALTLSLTAQGSHLVSVNVPSGTNGPVASPAGTSPHVQPGRSPVVSSPSVSTSRANLGANSAPRRPIPPAPVPGSASTLGKNRRGGLRSRRIAGWGLASLLLLGIGWGVWQAWQSPVASVAQPLASRSNNAQQIQAESQSSKRSQPSSQPGIESPIPVVVQQPPLSEVPPVASKVPEPSINTPKSDGVLTTRELVKLREPSVFRLLNPFGVGTGFVVKPGLVATNEHCIGQSDMEDIVLEFPSRPGTHYEDVQLAYAVPDTDLVVLRVGDLPTSFEPIPVLETSKLEKGERLIVIGNPGGLENVVTEGIFGSIQKLGPVTFLQLSVAINPGNSGGPAFTDRGLVAGVVTLKAAKNEGIGFAIPGDVLRSALLAVEEKPAAELARRVTRWRARQAGSQLLFACQTSMEIMSKYHAADQLAKQSGMNLDEQLTKIESETESQRTMLVRICRRIPDALAQLTENVIDAADLKLLQEMQQRYEWAKARALQPKDAWSTLGDDLEQLKSTLMEWRLRLKQRLGIMSFCDGNVQSFGGAN